MTAHAQFRDLEGRYPWINWREPVMMSVADKNEPHFGCRACIALKGIKAQDVAKLPESREAWDEHMKEEHGI